MPPLRWLVLVSTYGQAQNGQLDGELLKGVQVPLRSLLIHWGIFFPNKNAQYQDQHLFRLLDMTYPTLCNRTNLGPPQKRFHATERFTYCFGCSIWGIDPQCGIPFANILPPRTKCLETRIFHSLQRSILPEVKLVSSKVQQGSLIFFGGEGQKGLPLSFLYRFSSWCSWGFLGRSRFPGSYQSHGGCKEVPLVWSVHTGDPVALFVWNLSLKIITNILDSLRSCREQSHILPWEKGKSSTQTYHWLGVC